MGHPPPARHRRLLALIGAVFLLGRLAAPVLAMPMLASALLADASICQAEAGHDGGRADAPGAAADCLSCPACHAAAQPATLPAPPQQVAVLGWTGVAAQSHANVEGPPPHGAAPFRSRAPPLRA